VTESDYFARRFAVAFLVVDLARRALPERFVEAGAFTVALRLELDRAGLLAGFARVAVFAVRAIVFLLGFPSDKSIVCPDESDLLVEISIGLRWLTKCKPMGPKRRKSANTRGK
jgi:hypothetical protein